MFCMYCKNDLVDCTCDDLEERLRRAAGGGNFVYSECDKCHKHYARCKCKKPDLKTVYKPKDISGN